MTNIAFKGFLIPFTSVDVGTICHHQFYIFQPLEITIFFSDTAISTSYNLIFHSPHKNISNLNTDNKKITLPTLVELGFSISRLSLGDELCLLFRVTKQSSNNTFFSISG